MVSATYGHICQSSCSCCHLRSQKKREQGASPDAELSCDPDVNGLCEAPSFRAALGDPGQLPLCWGTWQTQEKSSPGCPRCRDRGCHSQPNLCRGRRLAEKLASRIIFLLEASEPTSVCRMEAISKASVRAKPPTSPQSTSSPGRTEDF